MPDLPDTQDVSQDPQAPAPTLQGAPVGSGNPEQIPNLADTDQQRPDFHPGVMTRVKEFLHGAYEGGIVGGLRGALYPAGQERDDAAAQSMQASRVKFASEQAAQMATQTAIQKQNLARMPEQVRKEQDDIGSQQQAQYAKAGVQPAFVADDSPTAIQGIYEHYTDTNGAIPPLAFVHASGKLYAYDLSNMANNFSGFQTVKAMAAPMGLPDLDFTDFQKLPEAKRIAMAQQAISFWQPTASADPKANANLISKYQSLKATYALKNPDDTATLDRFDATIENLQKQGAEHFHTATQLKDQAALNLAKEKAAQKAQGAAKIENMVVGSAADGSQVAGTVQELQAAGVTGITKLPSDEAKKVVVARQMTAPNGLFASVNEDLRRLDKNGKIGVVASRWSDFMAGKVGSEPEFQRLRTDMDLLATALMQAHVGARGSEQMLKHFQELADYRISDAATLRAALGREWSYVSEKAMRPKKPAVK